MIAYLKLVLSRLLSPFTQPPMPAPKDFKGKIQYDPNACIGCGLCVRFCPSLTIKMKPERKIRLDLTECCYCGTCEEVCPVKCIHLTREYSLTTTDKKSPELTVQ